jgi:hypothetical protein
LTRLILVKRLVAGSPKGSSITLGLNSNKGTKTLTGLWPKAFEQAFGSLCCGGTRRVSSGFPLHVVGFPDQSFGRTSLSLYL